MRKLIVFLGEKIHPAAVIALVVGLNAYWTGILEAFGAHFVTVSGFPLLDLQNVERILSAGEAQALIANYGPEAQTLYWSFFIMDNLMPPLVFSSFAVLWVVLLRRFPHRIADRLLNSPLLLVPLGVGLFDWLENLCFVTAITTESNSLLLLRIGLGFVWLKAICLFATFILTALFFTFWVGTFVFDRLKSRSSP
ncbi:MAG: hypothetical protein QNJ45_28450 [Ardenticatenaceae bacterium]|nr:hypothetical protein [Ardenticatenaceae bacterium]